jgi:hypothetical protein
MGNYRGIVLQPLLSRLFSSIVAGRLGEWLFHNSVKQIQAGFVRNMRATDNNVIIKTTVGKYLRSKQGY